MEVWNSYLLILQERALVNKLQITQPNSPGTAIVGGILNWNTIPNNSLFTNSRSPEICLHHRLKFASNIIWHVSQVSVSVPCIITKLSARSNSNSKVSVRAKSFHINFDDVLYRPNSDIPPG